MVRKKVPSQGAVSNAES
jgi:hypothetical protein